MEPIEVTAHFDDQGVITPLHFTWKGGKYRVESTGRRWQDDNSQHMLVMVTNGQIYELTFESHAGRWYIGQVGPNRVAV
jgi:hypothetical protein